MKIVAAKSVLESACSLGEGPVWAADSFWWVDIEKRRLHQWTPGQPGFASRTFPERIGFAVPAADGSWRIGLKSGIFTYDPATESMERLHDPEPDRPGNRFNDGKCDPQGRLWAGTMSTCGEKETGSLYQIRNGDCNRMLGPVTVSNGLAWDTDRNVFYYIDSPTREVVAFDYSPETGNIANKRIVWQVPEGAGFPDGMTIDTDGNLWVALWGGSGVACVDPQQGAVVGKIEVPAPQVTSCTFGGENHDTLYVTTARVGMKPEQLETHPLSGNVFAARPDARGLPVTLVS